MKRNVWSTCGVNVYTQWKRESSSDQNTYRTTLCRIWPRHGPKKMMKKTNMADALNFGFWNLNNVAWD